MLHSHNAPHFWLFRTIAPFDTWYFLFRYFWSVDDYFWCHVHTLDYVVSDCFCFIRYACHTLFSDALFVFRNSFRSFGYCVSTGLLRSHSHWSETCSIVCGRIDGHLLYGALSSNMLCNLRALVLLRRFLCGRHFLAYSECFVIFRYKYIVEWFCRVWCSLYFHRKFSICLERSQCFLGLLLYDILWQPL